MKKEPVRHHYIPQFILRNFCDKKGVLNYCDKKTNEMLIKNPRDIFVEKNLYRDEINYADNPIQIESDLARFENEVAHLIKEKFLVDSKILLKKEDEEMLKLFFAIMGFRSYNTQKNFGDDLSKGGMKLYSSYQVDENYQDFWKRNLGYLVNCRSLEEVLNHDKIDEPIKVFMRRDTYGYFGLHFSVVETRAETKFVLGDAYPAVVTGTGISNIPMHMYSICPISSHRCILLVGNGVENAPSDVLGFRKCVAYEPHMDSQKQLITIRVKKIYPEEVQKMNENIINAAKIGFVF